MFVSLKPSIDIVFSFDAIQWDVVNVVNIIQPLFGGSIKKLL